MAQNMFTNFQDNAIPSRLKLWHRRQKLKTSVLFCYKDFPYDHELYSMLQFLKHNYTNVDFLGFRPEMRPRENPGLSSEILFHKIAKYNPDIVFTYEKILAQHEIEHILSLGIKLITNTCGVHSFYYGAPPITQPEALSMLRQHALYLVPHAPHISKLRHQGINAVEFPLWFEPDWFHPLQKEKIYDILFIGDYTAPLNSHRLELMEFLSQNFRVTIASDQVPQIPNIEYLGASQDPRQLNLWLNQAHLVIGSDRLANIEVMNNLPGQFLFYEDEFFIRQRTYLMMGSGACYLVEKSRVIENKFKDGEEIVLWDGYPDLLEKVKQLLENPALRARISQNACLKSLAEHSTSVRVRRLIDLIDSLAT